MGMSSSLDAPETDRNVKAEKAGQEPQQALSDTVKTTRRRRLADLIANPFRSSPPETAVAKGDAGKGWTAVAKRHKQDRVDPPAIDKVLEVPEQVLRDLRGVEQRTRAAAEDAPFQLSKELEGKLASYAEKKAKEYDVLRQQGTCYEDSLGFESSCTKRATPIEVQANAVLQHLKKNDIARFYETAPKKRGYRGQEHPRFYGDHFLSNADLIEQTQLFALCRAMPKGAHLHIHFNANLLPSVLLGIAKDMPRMFIWSNIPLDRDEAFDLCRIQFSIMGEEAVKERGRGNPFDCNYEGGTVMQFQEFREAYPGAQEAADAWLQSKLVFQEEEAHNLLQTPEGSVCLQDTPRV
jgi:adenosine deaminase CECR1